MAFKIKDLMIHVVDPKQAQQAATRLCPIVISACQAPTFCHIPSACHLHTLHCTAIYSFCGTIPTVCHFPTQCGVLSGCGAVSPCGGLQSLCGPCSATFDPTIVEQGDPTVALATLKDQLKQAIGQVETQQAALSESLLPQTVAEAEDLEKRLQGALDELKARKADLQKLPKK